MVDVPLCFKSVTPTMELKSGIVSATYHDLSIYDFTGPEKDFILDQMSKTYDFELSIDTFGEVAPAYPTTYRSWVITRYSLTKARVNRGKMNLKKEHRNAGGPGRPIAVDGISVSNIRATLEAS